MPMKALLARFRGNTMVLIAGLGNFGPEYEHTRHNMGFEVIDELAYDLKLDVTKHGFNGVYGKGQAFGQDVILLKPLTYMNLSGTSVAPLMAFYKIPVENLLVVCDDMALKPGSFRPRIKGSSGGQKGLQNIIDRLGTQDFKRIRIGTGEPPHGKSQTVDYVLGKPDRIDRELIDKAQDQAIAFIEVFIKDGFQKAMDAVSKGAIHTDNQEA